MGLFNNFDGEKRYGRNKNNNTISKKIEPPDVIGELLEEGELEIEELNSQAEYANAFSLFKEAFEILGNRINSTFSIVVKESQVILLKLDDWKIYWLADDPNNITLQCKTKFDKINADLETFRYALGHLDTL